MLRTADNLRDMIEQQFDAGTVDALSVAKVHVLVDVAGDLSRIADALEKIAKVVTADRS